MPDIGSIYIIQETTRKDSCGSGGYLLGENEEANLFKNPEMLKRFKDILSFFQDKQVHILFALDAMIKSTKLETL
ncbi:hypothetical protein [Formosa sp. PL04]|uniref:hypothetical protein n=1 Tax=Formosa sp. PL04 TaxID=3081755 RepID=UPI002981F33A|nr:hypothetical protein [Formosa sp. PL04]MDW5289680.1 hypothetical protein [Formosa sp. PL04]